LRREKAISRSDAEEKVEEASHRGWFFAVADRVRRWRREENVALGRHNRKTTIASSWRFMEHDLWQRVARMGWVARRSADSMAAAAA
jgi:hypothetical protein